MRNYILFIILILLAGPSGLYAQAEQHLNTATELFEQGKYGKAAKIAQSVFAEAQQNNDLNLQVSARLLQAKSLHASSSIFNRRRNQERIEMMLKNLYRRVSIAQDEALIEQVAASGKQLMDMDMEAATRSEMNPGGLAAEQPPQKIRDIARERIKEFHTYNDSLNAELSTLKVEKGALENEIMKLNLEQARQQLMLARKEKAIDSIAMARIQDSLMVAQQEEKLQRKEAELALRETQRNRSLMLSIAIIIIAGILFWLYFNTRRKNSIIEMERARSDELLLNILPASVAGELKTKGYADTRYYEQVTVLFSDFKGFTEISSHMSPQLLVKELDECFRAFDDIIERHGLEKIKTIGDAYMCAGGLPEESTDHAQRAVRAAQEMQEWLKNSSKRMLRLARIGIHTGPVIAGVVGARKFAYDIWGETVNIAARMESQGEPGQINISQTTYELIKKDFSATYRGKLPAKGIGELEMHFVA
jgi:class 3 adenylate cyclase